MWWHNDNEMTEQPCLTVEQVSGMLEAGTPVSFVDSRNPIAWASSKMKVPGAIRLPLDEADERLDAIPRDHHLIVYCT